MILKKVLAKRMRSAAGVMFGGVEVVGDSGGESKVGFSQRALRAIPSRQQGSRREGPRGHLFGPEVNGVAVEPGSGPVDCRAAQRLGEQGEPSADSCEGLEGEGGVGRLTTMAGWGWSCWTSRGRAGN